MKLYTDIFRKSIIAIILVNIGVIAMMAQSPSLRQAFLDAPADVIPSLGDVERSNALKAYDAMMNGEDVSEPTKNVLGAEVKILQLTDSYLRMTLDQSTEMQLKLLPYKRSKGYVISMVVTSLLVPKQSVMVFYDKDWNRLDTDDFIQLPSSEDYFINPADLQRREVKEALVERGRWSYQIIFDLDDSALTFKPTTFDEEVARNLHPEVEPLLKKEGVRYEWSKRSKSFKKR